MRRNHIAIDARMWNASGIGTYLRNTVPAVVSHLRISNKVNIFANTNEMQQVSQRLDHRVDVVPLDSPIYSIQEQWTLPRALANNVDLVFIPHYIFTIFPGVKLLVTVHDAIHLARPEFFPGRLKRIYAKTMLKSLARSATKIVCNSQ